MQKIVIFDMDGTLIDSKKDITTSINYVRQHNHNLPPLSEEFVVEAINLHERNLPDLFYATPTYQHADKEVFESHYKQQCIQNSTLFDGVEEMLHTLHAKGVKMGVATNAPTLFAQTMLEHLGVVSLFEKIVGADQVNSPKPDPQMLDIILKTCHYDNTQDKAWMVGDNSKDMQAAENISIEGIFVTWGFSEFGEYRCVVHTPQELVAKVL
jgi:phosphoglycolate phosphatase